MMPMPAHINSEAVGAVVSQNKDVECLNPQNIGEVFMGRSCWAPCTPPCLHGCAETLWY